jgi:hypothetical protein
MFHKGYDSRGAYYNVLASVFETYVYCTRIEHHARIMYIRIK